MIDHRADLVHEEITELWHGLTSLQQFPVSDEDIKAAKIETLDAIADSIYVPYRHS